MKQSLTNFAFVFLSLLSSLAYALPTTGNCEITNYRTTFTGKGLIYGPKSTSGDEYQGDFFVSFDYVCKAWNHSSTHRLGTVNLSNSYGSGNAFRSNTWGTVLQATLALVSVTGQPNNMWFETFNPNEIDTDGFLRGSISKRMFYIDKNGTVGGGAGGAFPAGTDRLYMIEQPFNVIFWEDAGGRYNTVASNVTLASNIRVYDPTCNVSAPNTVNVGEINAGAKTKQHFSITVHCQDSVTVQSKVLTKFTNSTPDSTLSSDSRTIQYRGTNGVKVDMSIQDELDNDVSFGTEHEYKILDKDQASYNIGYNAAFEPLAATAYNDFSFTINYELTYN
ncbi:hypothetical protein [Vibrio owensii]|uniref:hypothetical protein n=1 Tax=Vibrio owensii TaxID=696485 RepID=UPI001267CD58|nr:hypothetical protein [Vibrio owensii]